MELCLSPDLGGLELYMQRCCRELQPDVVAVVTENGRLYERLQSEEVSVLTVGRKFRALPILAARRLAKIIDSKSIDVIHMHWTKDLPLVALAKYFSSRKPMLVSTRQMKITRPKRDFYHNFLYRQVDLHITITKALAEEMRHLLNPDFSDRIIPLYYGVAPPKNILTDMERKEKRNSMGLSDSTFVSCMVGRIKEYKGQHLLVDAVGQAIDEGYNVAAVIVGHAMEDEYLKKIKERVKENGWQDRILFYDFVENPQDLMQACDVVVLGTVEETFGLVLVEAMRAGVAVIGSNRGGVLEIIEHEENGLLFDSMDSNDLYKKISLLLKDDKLRKKISAAGKEKADHMFDESVHFESLKNIFKEKYFKYRNESNS